MNKKFDWYGEKITLNEFLKELFIKIVIDDEGDCKRLMGNSGWQGELLSELIKEGILKVKSKPCCKEENMCSDQKQPCYYKIAYENSDEVKKEINSIIDAMYKKGKKT